ncbi:MAG: hypothetical protein FWH15_10175 [Betaproteobacteria bacterium]|nr:hypothetical protein [Betaproteobacteria bacterium]
MTAIKYLELLCALIVVFRIGCICANFPRAFLKFHKIRAVIICLALAFMASGAIAVILNAPYSGELLLFSATFFIVGERRFIAMPRITNRRKEYA